MYGADPLFECRHHPQELVDAFPFEEAAEEADHPASWHAVLLPRGSNGLFVRPEQHLWRQRVRHDRYTVGRDAPGGGGKIRVGPNYIISWSTNKVVLRNYEGVITTYKEPDSYEAGFCDRECERCELQLNLDDSDEGAAIGIHKLLADYDDTVALTPADNERRLRRDEN